MFRQWREHEATVTDALRGPPRTREWSRRTGLNGDVPQNAHALHGTEKRDDTREQA